MATRWCPELWDEGGPRARVDGCHELTCMLPVFVLLRSCSMCCGSRFQGPFRRSAGTIKFFVVSVSVRVRESVLQCQKLTKQQPWHPESVHFPQISSFESCFTGSFPRLIMFMQFQITIRKLLRPFLSVFCQVIHSNHIRTPRSGGASRTLQRSGGVPALSSVP